MNTLLNIDDVKTGLAPVSKEEAIKQAGKLLVERGCVEPSYIDAMLEREKLVSTYMGEGLAIPHGTSEAKGLIKKTGLSVLQFPDGVDFGEERAYLVVGIAGVGDEHLSVISAMAELAMEPEKFEEVKKSIDAAFIHKCFTEMKVEL